MDYGYKLTTNGRALLARCMAEEKPLIMTRVVVGSGTVPEDTDLADIHELVNYITDGEIGDRSHRNDRLYFSVRYSNASHKDIRTFCMTEFMIYAKCDENGEDVDLLYATLGDYTQMVPAFTSTLPAVTFTFPLILVVADDVTVEIDAASSVVTFDDLEDALSTIRVIIGIGPPTTETAGSLGQHYIDTSADREYTCFGYTDDGYQWRAIGSGGADEASIREIIASEFAGLAGARMTLAFTLPASGWKSGSGYSDYPYYRDITNSEITASMVPQVTFDEESQPKAAALGVCACVRTYDGYIRFLSAAQPAEALSGVCCLTERVVFTGGGIEFTISTGDWLNDGSGSYPYYYDLAGLAIMEALVPQVVFDEESQSVAATAGVSASVTTYDNYARFRSMDRPGTALSGVLYLLGKHSGSSSSGSGSTYTLRAATRTSLGGVKVGNGINIATDGTISIDSSTGVSGDYTLPVATATRLGGVKIPSDSGIVVDTNGNVRLREATDEEIDALLSGKEGS